MVTMSAVSIACKSHCYGKLVALLWQAAKLLLAQVHLEGDNLHIDQEGRARKFTNKVQQKTFAASSANGRPVMYVTERAVFKLVEGKGLELVEIAPGVMQEPKTHLLVSIAVACLSVHSLLKSFLPVRSSFSVWPWVPWGNAACCCSH